MRPQCAQLLKYIEEHGSITQNEADACLHIKRLAARALELRELGYPLYGESETGVNADGGPVRYSRYWMHEKGERNA